MTVRDSETWKAAEWAYTDLHATRMMPIPGMRTSADEFLNGLAEIVQECPEFYPAVLEYGIGGLVAGRDGADEMIENGIRLMLEHGDHENIEDEVHILIENLENVRRFDVARRCLERLVELYPENAMFHDYLGYAASRTGDIQTALRHASNAAAMAPDDSHFISNLGLFHLMAGNLDEAEEHLTAALALDAENEVAKDNLQIHAYAAQHGGNFFDYFLRPPDRELIERLVDEEDFERLDELCESYNRDRLAAFGQSLTSGEEIRSRCNDILDTLRNFFDFVDRVSQMPGVLDEDISFLHENFDPIMNKFIFKFRDADGQTMQEICDWLIDYYGFLSRQKLVSNEEFQRFQRMVRRRKKGVVKKAERYGEVRHDTLMTDDEKEAIREQLFEGDHCWPHL